MWKFVIPFLIVPQYFLALYALTRLAYLQMPAKKYIAWNIFIMVGLYFGPIIFLILYAKKAAQAKKQMDTPMSAEPEKSPKGDE